VIDLPVMTKVGFAIAVANAHDTVKQYANLITEKSGGHGAVREVCDFILKAHHTMTRHFRCKRVFIHSRANCAVCVWTINEFC
jgi:3-deoxy-D-manno-octulosonate 8-phosphate phosphatase KdsC-like HAD superfamily phosphatase